MRQQYADESPVACIAWAGPIIPARRSLTVSHRIASNNARTRLDR